MRVVQLAVAVAAQVACCEKVRSQHHQHHDAEHRVAALALVAATLTAEARTVLRRIGDANRAAIHAEEREATPPMGVGAAPRPLRRAAVNHPLHGLAADALARLRYGAPCDGAARGRQREIELSSFVTTSSMGRSRKAKEPHPEHDPDHLFRRKPPPARRCGARRCERRVDPRRIDVLPKIIELRRRRKRRCRMKRAVEPHALRPPRVHTAQNSSNKKGYRDS
jgi:hypothetical protein